MTKVSTPRKPSVTERTVPALRCNQGEKFFYVFNLSVSQLAEICYVSQREASPHGYQRLLDKKRAEAIKTYIESGRTLPNNIIVNFNAEETITFNEESKSLTFPNKPRIAWIIDGQHRLYGADLLNSLLFGQGIADSYEFLVSAFVGLSLVDQARIFLDINSYQEGVDKSLLYDLLDMFKTDDATSPEFYLVRASDIVKRLNHDPESPFYNHISLTRDRIKGLISQAAFVDALVPHLERGGILSHTSEYQFTLEEQYRIVLNYFTAVRNILPTFWFNDKMLLTKTTGFNALFQSLPTVFEQTLRRYSSFTLDSVEQIVAPLQSVPWHSRELEGQQGTVAARKLAEVIRATIISNLENTDSDKPKLRIQL